uniref:AN1-type domain-containing protein n=1 Tax=viral metagenome TaxID=1070528 RepID=A0A6C0APS2_9ZZZZ
MSSDARLRYFMQSLKLQAGSELVTDEEPTLPTKDTKAEAKPPKRCQLEGCNKKLSLINFPCKCLQFYCASHRFSDSHSCTFDYKGAGKELLAKQLVEVKGSRIDKI